MQTIESLSNFPVISYFTLICGRRYNNQWDLVNNWNRFHIHLCFIQLGRIFLPECFYPSFSTLPNKRRSWNQASAARDGRRFTRNVSTADRVANDAPITTADGCEKNHTKKVTPSLSVGAKVFVTRTQRWGEDGCCGSETRGTRLNGAGATCLKLPSTLVLERTDVSVSSTLLSF